MTLCVPSVETPHLADHFCFEPCVTVPDESFEMVVGQRGGRLSQVIFKNQREKKKNPPKSPCVRLLTYLLVNESSHLFFCCSCLTLYPPLRPAAPSLICFNTSTSLASSTSGSNKLFSLLFSPGKLTLRLLKRLRPPSCFPSHTVLLWSCLRRSLSSMEELRLFSALPPTVSPPPPSLQSVFGAGLNKEKLKGEGEKVFVCLPVPTSPPLSFLC